MKNKNSFVQTLLVRMVALAASAVMMFQTTNVSAALPFTAGNVVVFSADTASANNTTFSILELNKTTAAQSSPVNTVAISGTGANALRTSGSATSTGYLSDSDDGSLVLFDAHNSATTSGNANTLTARGAGTLNNAGTFNLAATYTGTSGNQARGATTVNNSLIYVSDQGGIFTNGSVNLLNANTRSIKTFGGTKYVLQQSTTLANTVVSTLSADGKTITGLPGMTNDSGAQDFYLVSSGSNGSAFDVLYVNTNSSATSGAIKKYSLVSGSWVTNGSYATGFSGFSLCAATNGSGVVLYVTSGTGASAANNLVRLTDTNGYNTAIGINTASNVTLYTAASGTTMKGVAFAPVAPAAVAPTVTASAATGISSNSATLNGNVTADNGSAITERGFVYKTSPGVTISDNKTNIAGTTGAYSLTLVLNPNTQYYLKAYAINAGGTTLSTETNFWTLANVPAAPMVASPTTNSLQVTVNANGNPAATTFAIHETTLNQYVQADGSLNASAVFQMAATWGTKVVTGLITNTTYTFEVKARNGELVETAFGASASGTTATNVPAGITSVNLNNYVRIGRYSLPDPSNTTPPDSTNYLCQEASGVAYNWDTDTLFIIGDGARSVTQVSKTGILIDSMTLALGSSPQGTEFYDTEGITYIGGGQFVFTEERDRQLVKFTYAAGTVLTRANTQTVDLGTFVPNTGTEGLSYDPQTGGFICIKEISPMGVFQTDVDFNTGLASNGGTNTVNSTDLFNPALLGVTDLADVFALSNLPGLTNQTDSSHLLLLSQENAKVLNVDRSGNTYSTLTITADLGDILDVANMQHEGLTMDRDGKLYIVNENGGGDINHPQLWVYAPSALPNQAPTALTLTNKVNSIAENTSTASAIKVADIFVADDGLGTNVLTVSGADASFFHITGNALFLNIGVVLDFETKTNYTVTVNVDDISVGTTPDATNTYNLAVTDVINEGVANSTNNLVITEVASWFSSSPVGSDWFEVSNLGTNIVDITGWKIDDSSAAIATAATLNGVTNIAPGESVIFLETANLAATKATFLNVWFGANTPTNLQVGSYTGSGLGLSTGGDGVCLFDSNSNLIARVAFGAAPAGPKLATFDNAAGINGTNVSLIRLSVPRVYGAFIAANDYNEIGSPGSIGGLIISEVAAFASGSSPVAADWIEVLNTSPNVIDITGWKFDDSSKLFSSAAALTGVTNIAPGEAVIFLETATLATTKSNFLTNWFGANPPTNLQVGAYSGSGLGLSTGGDGANLFDSIGTLRASVTFGGSPLAAPFKTFDNTFGLNIAVISELSVTGVHGAFAAVNNTNEIGSPGIGSKVIISEIAPWSSGNSPLAADWFELSNVGATPVNLTGWKMDDSSQSPAGAGALTGVTNLAPGESAIFIDTATLSTTKSNFLANWFGTNAPADLQVGAYPAGNGLSTGGDGVTLYNQNNALMAVVTFGINSAAPYRTFDNAAGVDGLVNSSVSQLSTNGSNGAFAAVNSPSEIGSPGILTVPTMAFVSAGGQLNLYWSVEATGYRLEATANLITWTNLPQSVVLTNGQLGVSIPQTNDFRVYRLRK